MQKNGELGVVRAGALADLIVVDGDPVADMDLFLNPQGNLPIIMKNGILEKNSLSGEGKADA